MVNAATAVSVGPFIIVTQVSQGPMCAGDEKQYVEVTTRNRKRKRNGAKSTISPYGESNYSGVLPGTGLSSSITYLRKSAKKEESPWYSQNIHRTGNARLPKTVGARCLT
jgi:hypothetical protein